METSQFYRPQVGPQITDLLQFNELDVVRATCIKTLGHFTHRVTAHGREICLTRGFNNAAYMAGRLRITNGEAVKIERLRPRVIQGDAE